MQFVLGLQVRPDYSAPALKIPYQQEPTRRRSHSEAAKGWTLFERGRWFHSGQT
jgi:hypothetical protein